MPTASSATAGPRVWVLTSKKLGDNAQVLAIAQDLGWPYEAKTLVYTGLNHFHFRVFGPSLRKVALERSSQLSPPWPDVVLTVGRRAVPVALWIRQQSRGATKLVQVGQSRVKLDRFDLVVANPQYHLPPHPRLVRLELPLLYGNAEAIAAAAATWRERFATLPRPWTALFVGGSTAPFALDTMAVRDLMGMTHRLLTRDGGSLLVTTSRRTPSDAADFIRDAMPAQGFFHRWSPNGASNPYLGMLGLADRFLVTGESISMLVEVVRQGKPLAIYPLPERTLSFRLRVRRLLQDALLPQRHDTNAPRSLRERCGDFLVRCGALEYRRDFTLFHRRLIDRQLAVWAGEPFPQVTNPPPDDLPFVVERIRALFPSVARA
ncbi:MAG: mitochondrial fission ELM1 family protein [Deltaproteobacteria bacterium]|nr:mitochondrial fission ELM1 family protein [Deltaproteobacteria bacterium]